MERLTLGGFALRLVAALALVLLTYNPTGKSWVHWAYGTLPSVTPVLVLSGLVLVAAWAFFLRATTRSLGLFGVLLGIGVCATLGWLFASWGWLTLSTTGALPWFALVMLACLLAFGLSWSHVQRRVTGQADVEEVDAKL